jgi:hypothetical protein
MIRKYIVKGICGAWSGLGFYRGYQSYYDDEINKSPSPIKAIGYGFCGLFVYINPFSLPLIINAEYKRFKTS